MTITRGQPWGRPGVLPVGRPVLATDRELAHHVAGVLHGELPRGPVGLLGGDLHRTMGGTGRPDRLRDAGAMRLPVDVGVVQVDGAVHVFVAHLIARRNWLRGEIVVVMNAQWMGEWNLGPRAHPNDGFLDLFRADLPFRDRMLARTRLRTGSHLPHPDISSRRVKRETVTMSRVSGLWVDGVHVVDTDTFEVSVHPDAVEVVVG